MARKGKGGGNTAPAEQSIIDQPLGDILSQRYLSYALSTIMSRSLPDVRDGLKPVHRRLLYAMYQLKLGANTGPKKSARVVGDVIGKFHPHGDQSVYDALVRLAQDFAVRYPLVDGQGNFGNIDGDNAAAMRYTEARMTTVAELLLEGLDEDAVNFRPTYDGDGSEPVVMPANFPNLLANGSSGIAVGMATNIPPHNVAELCEAMELMLDSDKEPEVKDLMKIVKGPDFPTGGILVEPRENILEAYRIGKGSLRLRAKWEREDGKRGTYQIVVTEIPYQVQKSKLVERIAELINDRKVPMLDDVRDESAEDIRLVLVPKSQNVEPELLMEALFRQTDLEIRFALNMNVLDNGVMPKVMNLKEALRAWLMHRQDVLVRRSQHRLQQVLHRIEVLEGYLIVYLNIDKVIKIIRESDEPKPELMKKFKLTDVQAEAILNMRLRSLRKLEEIEIKQEHDSLSKERDHLNALLKSEAKQWKEIRKQVGEIKKLFGADTALGARRTKIAKAPAPVDVEALQETLMPKEPVTVICSDKGWIRAMKGHGLDHKDFKYKDGDKEGFVVETQTTDKLSLFATNGRFYTIGCDKLPPGRGFGEPVRLMIDLPNDADILTVRIYNPDEKFLVASDDGRGFVVEGKEILAQTKNGKQVLNLDEGSEARVCVAIPANADHLAVIGSNRKMLVFPLAEVPVMGKGKGVILQKFKDGSLSDAKAFNLKFGLTYMSRGSETPVKDIKLWIGERAQAGRLPPNGFPSKAKF
jgi:topoisomerase-4 subunit A